MEEAKSSSANSLDRQATDWIFRNSFSPLQLEFHLPTIELRVCSLIAHTISISWIFWELTISRENFPSRFTSASMFFSAELKIVKWQGSPRGSAKLTVGKSLFHATHMGCARIWVACIILTSTTTTTTNSTCARSSKKIKIVLMSQERRKDFVIGHSNC